VQSWDVTDPLPGLDTEGQQQELLLERRELGSALSSLVAAHAMLLF